MKLDTYLNLCSQYYEIDKPNAPQDELEFFMYYAKNAKGPILEPMCGTGRFLLPMIEAGINVEGFDASPTMLKILEDKAKAKKVKVNVWQQFIQDKQKDKKYDLIFIPSGSFGLIIDMKEINKSITTLYKQLIPGGKCILEAETMKATPKEFGKWSADVRNCPDGAMILISGFHLPFVDNIVSTICRYDLVEKGTITQTEIEKMQIRLYNPKDLIKLLKDIGFSKVSAIKAYQHGKAFDSTDEIVVYECIK